MVSILIFLSTFFDLETFLKDFEVFFKMFDLLRELLNPFYLSDFSTFVLFSFSLRFSYFRRILYLITLKKVFYFCKVNKLSSLLQIPRLNTTKFECFYA